MSAPRKTVRERRTAETLVRVEAVLGTGKADIRTTVPFLDHMMTVLAKYSGIDLTIRAEGDLRHHLIEDVALTVGPAIADALPATAARYGERMVPYYEGPIPSSLYDHWMRSFCDAGKFTLHLMVVRGTDRHHIVEAAFKALGFALRQAAVDSGAVFSTKGAIAMEAK
jgi:imidazoleglycerol-phosphate dehydratase